MFKLVASLVDKQTDYLNEYQRALKPISTFVDSIIPIQQRMLDILPLPPVCDRLVRHYLVVSESLHRLVHIPSFEQEYAQYREGRRVNETFLPRLLCILSIAARFGTDSRGLIHDRRTSIHIPTACVLVRRWLDDRRREEAVDPAGLQTELLLLLAQRTTAVEPKALWAQLGYVVRMAMRMGLQRDPSESDGLTNFSMECRRRLWFTIMELDLQVSLTCNLPCALGRADYSCRPPRNLDDVDMNPDASDLPESKPLDKVTINQFQAYSARTLPIRLEAVALLNRAAAVKDYSEPLEIGSKLEKMLDDIDALFPRHLPLDQPDGNKAWNCHLLLDMHVRLPLMRLYSAFALGSTDCPPQLSQSFLKSCMAVLAYINGVDHQIKDYSEFVAMLFSVLEDSIIEAAFSVCCKQYPVLFRPVYGYLGSLCDPKAADIPLSCTQMFLNSRNS